jgi:excisionase family DNA binding protein
MLPEVVSRMNDTKRLLSAYEVAELLNDTRPHVLEMAREGLLPCVRLGRKVRFDPEVVQEFIRTGGRSFPGGWRREAS